ncbi:hypothetical protein SH1V18_00470 [Vallitalea longa]|uniref:Uncharacterized protein n=1 Tax=Vallitalea longa TaxID=2936439 RepID=A0A9W5Y7B0_9FIRM|nr:HAD family hydrolase [Vallitalea longa]GKX27567.1 hypothetical protein SH1V18_00470 [Vallitalea longa]
MKKYRAIFFDWDGTAVVSRTASADKVIKPMIELLKQEIKLIIISGTTYENINGGLLHTLVPQEYLGNLYLGLGRGAYNYGFTGGEPVLMNCILPNAEEKILIHKITFSVHQYLLQKHNLNTDIVFSRPNYCKLDIMVDKNRKDKLFLQIDEISQAETLLKKHGLKNGLTDIINICKEIAHKYSINIDVTTDAKYVEIGISTKSDNVNYFMDKVIAANSITKEECCFFGDEFTYLTDDIRGSDAYMITNQTIDCDFFDVSSKPLKLPTNVNHIGGGTDKFIDFLSRQCKL